MPVRTAGLAESLACTGTVPGGKGLLAPLFGVLATLWAATAAPAYVGAWTCFHFATGVLAVLVSVMLGAESAHLPSRPLSRSGRCRTGDSFGDKALVPAPRARGRCLHAIARVTEVRPIACWGASPRRAS